MYGDDHPTRGCRPTDHSLTMEALWITTTGALWIAVSLWRPYGSQSRYESYELIHACLTVEASRCMRTPVSATAIRLSCALPNWGVRVSPLLVIASSATVALIQRAVHACTHYLFVRVRYEYRVVIIKTRVWWCGRPSPRWRRRHVPCLVQQCHGRGTTRDRPREGRAARAREHGDKPPKCEEVVK